MKEASLAVITRPNIEDPQKREYLVVCETGAGKEGLYGFPGGRVEPGEDPGLAAERETREETGLEVEVAVSSLLRIHYLRSVEHGGPILLNIYEAELKGGEIHISHEHPDVQWLTTKKISELMGLGNWRHPIIASTVLGRPQEPSEQVLEIYEVAS